MNQLTKPLVFVCSPYRGDVDANARQAERYCRFVFDRQCVPFAPHLLFTRFLDDGREAERDAGIAMGIQMLSLCNELWAFGSPTPGMAREIEAARTMGIPVRWFDASGVEMTGHGDLEVTDQYDLEVEDHE